jgi:hypothetical protein
MELALPVDEVAANAAEGAATLHRSGALLADTRGKAQKIERIG